MRYMSFVNVSAWMKKVGYQLKTSRQLIAGIRKWRKIGSAEAALQQTGLSAS
jgi:hypothetical protein